MYFIKSALHLIRLFFAEVANLIDFLTEPPKKKNILSKCTNVQWWYVQIRAKSFTKITKKKHSISIENLFCFLQLRFSDLSCTTYCYWMKWWNCVQRWQFIVWVVIIIIHDVYKHTHTARMTDTNTQKVGEREQNRQCTLFGCVWARDIYSFRFDTFGLQFGFFL